MMIKKGLLILYTFASIILTSFCVPQEYTIDPSRVLAFEVNPSKLDVQLYWKNGKGEIYGSIENLKNDIASKKQELIFAMNGGMYMENQVPLGLYIEKGKVLRKLNKVKKAYGNFYMQPNGVFYLTISKKATVIATEKFTQTKDIQYATQSGPMLLINGKMHPKFRKGSKNVNIRNGVGVLPNGNMLFVMSKELINFYDFATYFKQRGCINALYLDGAVSKMYVPSKKWTQLGGNFGVMIGVTSKK